MKERGRMDEGNEEGGDTQRKRKKELVRDREGRRGKGKGGEEFRSLKGEGRNWRGVEAMALTYPSIPRPCTPSPLNQHPGSSALIDSTGRYPLDQRCQHPRAALSFF